ncbi:MAG: hypothetical protein FWD90_06815 [Defluviitaleaceae bacterium]|nr:hypothetical protein [Defluviitaleaceae bacterium]
MTPIPDYADSSLDVAMVKALVMELLTPEQKTELQKHKFLDFSYTHGNLGRFRACVYTQRGTHALSIHPLPFDVPDIYSLDFTDDLLHTVNKTIKEKCGLVVVAGDSSIRLSQTLAALVDLTNQQRECHISTIENPIKYLHRHKKGNACPKRNRLGCTRFQYGSAPTAARKPRCRGVKRFMGK